jgi:hypothetical protein
MSLWKPNGEFCQSLFCEQLVIISTTPWRFCMGATSSPWVYPIFPALSQLKPRKWAWKQVVFTAGQSDVGSGQIHDFRDKSGNTSYFPGRPF